jgi:hypothetical protein
LIAWIFCICDVFFLPLMHRCLAADRRAFFFYCDPEEIRVQQVKQMSITAREKERGGPPRRIASSSLL